jgi:hypothetical protein
LPLTGLRKGKRRGSKSGARIGGFDERQLKPARVN